jgi:beta-glucosidase
MNAIKAVVLAVLSLIGILIALVGGLLLRAKLASLRNLGRLGEDAPDLLIDGIPFRDLNKNGRLDIYEDFRRPIDERVEDLLGQMTLEEKVGLMMHPMISPNKQGDLAEMPSIMSPLSTSEMVINRHIVHFNIVFA